MARKRNVMQVVGPDVLDQNIVRVGTYEDAWSVSYGQYVVECWHCECLFLTDRPQTKYHSKACRQAAYRKRKAGA